MRARELELISRSKTTSASFPSETLVLPIADAIASTEAVRALLEWD
jgi:hypothetical protein